MAVWCKALHAVILGTQATDAIDMNRSENQHRMWQVVRMYERLGFTSDPAGIKGLAYRKNAATGAFLMERGSAQPTKYISIIDDARCDKFARST